VILGHENAGWVHAIGSAADAISDLRAVTIRGRAILTPAG
jgi:D-arabinose 1-dehydrogenase-like Zn-dependent alcohol dehydrogenase